MNQIIHSTVMHFKQLRKFHARISLMDTVNNLRLFSCVPIVRNFAFVLYFVLLLPPNIVFKIPHKKKVWLFLFLYEAVRKVMFFACCLIITSLPVSRTQMTKQIFTCDTFMYCFYCLKLSWRRKKENKRSEVRDRGGKKKEHALKTIFY